MKNVLVTGAASGLGRHLANMYADKGYTVYAVDVDSKNLDTLQGGKLIPMCMDIAEPDQWEDVAVKKISADGNGLDIVVACAAIMRLGNVEDCSYEDWQFVNSVNLTGQYLTAKMTMPFLKKNKGNILFIGSPSAKLAVRDEVCYVTFKHAICGLSKSIAFDFGAEGVRSNVLHPGWMRTAMSDQEMEEIMERDKVSLDEAYKIVTRFVPLKRPADLSEIGESAAYLTEGASYITGAELMVDGGVTIVDPGMMGFL